MQIQQFYWMNVSCRIRSFTENFIPQFPIFTFCDIVASLIFWPMRFTASWFGLLTSAHISVARKMSNSTAPKLSESKRDSRET